MIYTALRIRFLIWADRLRGEVGGEGVGWRWKSRTTMWDEPFIHVDALRHLKAVSPRTKRLTVEQLQLIPEIIYIHIQWAHKV
jgi:hypothetical protein